MDIITIVYLVFILISLYIYSFFLLILFKNKHSLFTDNTKHNSATLSILIPAYNEEATIAQTIESIQNTNYPKDKIEIIVLDDGSTDKTAEIAKQFKDVKVISKQNSGKADSLNIGIKQATGEFIAVIDADSYPEQDAIDRMMAYFADEKVAAVTSCIKVDNQHKFWTRLQVIEYTIIAWARKLLQYVNSVYVTPGALSIYRTKVLKEIEGFDKNNLTEDIEIAWRILKKNYKIKMCLLAKVHTTVPDKFKAWWRQRLRWDLGGMQTLYKHKGEFLRPHRSILGAFVAPFFTVSMAVALIGFFVFTFLLLKRLLNYILLSFYSYESSSIAMQVKSIYLTPTVFTFFGALLLITYITYITLGIKMMDKTRIPLNKKFNIACYMLIYLPLFPILLLHSLVLILTGRMIKW